MSLETELKLYIAPEDCSKLLQHPLLQSSQTQTQQLYNSYFDTPKHELLQQGIGLRVRHIGKKRIQTIKTAGKGLGGLHKRQEWETEITADTPDYSKFPKKALPVKKKTLKQIEVIFTTNFQRTTWDLQLEKGSEIEVALDEGKVQSKTAESPISELELELKAGTPNQLYKIALILQKDIPLLIENKSKAERGYALYNPPTLTYHKAGAVELHSKMTAEQAFIHIISYCLSHLQANEDIVLYGEDIEGVHQMRVALRRLRSCLNLYNHLIPYETHTELRNDIKWISEVLGVARDWDVFVHNLQQIQSDTLQNFKSTVATLQAQAYIEVRQAMRSQRYTRLLLSLGQWLTERYWRKNLNANTLQKLDSPIKDFATKILNKHYQRVSKQGKNLSQLNPEQLHNLRISIKKMAYGTRFFTALYPSEATRTYVKSLSSLQDELGILNDTNVANSLLDKALLDNNAPARYFLKGWYAHQEMTHKNALEKAWQAFLKTKLFWTK
jgi:inorganic triphosphatase YgiF